MFRHSKTLAGTAVLAAALAVGVSPAVRAQGGATGGATGGAANAPAPSPSAPANNGQASATPAPGATDLVLARVDGKEIHMSDISAAAQGLPQQMQNVPPTVLLPMLLDQLIDRYALAAQARKSGLEKQEDVQRQMQAAADRVLQAAYVTREISPKVTDEVLRARYDRDIAGKPGAEEVHARHILVKTEAEAKKIIAALQKGGDFAALAKKHSTDPGAQQGGDLGFFKQDDMVPEFAAAAFALKPGEITQAPVKTQFGYHVIKLEERRSAPPPSFEDAHDDLRQKAIQEAYQALTKTARADVKIERFNTDGSVPSATDTAEPPPAKPR
jgi:peptidyl-prolyl cis-trans isomerase C